MSPVSFQEGEVAKVPIIKKGLLAFILRFHIDLIRINPKNFCVMPSKLRKLTAK